jgi:hypothetical protein
MVTAVSEALERQRASWMVVGSASLQPTSCCQRRGIHATKWLYGLTLFHELMSVERAGIGLALLADLIAAKKLRPQIAVEAPWSEIGTIARRLIDREFTGKAVPHVL